jgi:predicted HicB family RNase H-like nuclease
MFRIQKGYDSESKSFRLPIDLLERLNELAAQNKISLNKLVIQCLNYAVDNLEKTNDRKSDKT